MRIHRTVTRCRWAEPTLFLQSPLWLDASSYPWSCRASGAYRPIVDTRLCRTCERWTPCEPARRAGQVRPVR